MLEDEGGYFDWLYETLKNDKNFPITDYEKAAKNRCYIDTERYKELVKE